MTSTTDPQLVTAAETARLLGVTRQRVLELVGSTDDFPAAVPTATGGWVWPRGAGAGGAVTGPDLPRDSGRPWQIWAVLNRAADEAHELNHPWIGDEHLVLGMLHPDCPGAARRVLESFGIRAEPFRQAFILPHRRRRGHQRACPARLDQPRPLPAPLGHPLRDHR